MADKSEEQIGTSEARADGYRPITLPPLMRRGHPIDPTLFGPDEYVTLPVAARLPELCVNGLPKNPSQIYRMVEQGIDGVRLRTARQGKRLRVTTRRWVREFIEALAERDRVGAPLAACVDGLDAHRKRDLQRSAWLNRSH